MVWRGTTIKDRILACLPYLVPILEVLALGNFLFALIPPLGLLFLPLQPLQAIYYYPIGQMQIVPFLVFFGLYIGVVQSQTLGHFLRFNTMQALVLAVFAWLCETLLRLFGISQQLVASSLGGLASSATTIVIGIVLSAIFIVVVGASIYAVVQSLRGQYAQMPLISEAAYSQVR